MKRVCRFHFFALALPLLFLSLPPRLAGQAESAGILLGDVGLYPPDANIERDPADRHRSVFFDTKTRDIVLAYRAAPGLPRTVRRIEIPIHVAPIIVSIVSQTPQGGYRYRYLVANGPAAKQAIHRWFLDVPRPKAPDPTKPIPQAEGAWERSPYSRRPGEWTIRFDSRPAKPLAANRTARFVMDDEDRPGFIEARFQGDTAALDSLPGDLPQAVREQLQELLRINGLEYRTVWTLGPRYAKWDPAFAIAADFLTKLRMLADQGVLDGNSPFVRAAAARLEEFAERPRPWIGEATAWAVNEPFPPIGQSANPLSRVERQFETAIDLALTRPRSFSVEH